MLWLTFAVCVAFGIIRFLVPVHGLTPTDVFKDVAHLFVGGLFGAAIARFTPCGGRARTMMASAIGLWAMAIGLTALEVAAFLLKARP